MTYCIKAKCTTCGLHFAAYSWEQEWRPRFCPECGESNFLVWSQMLPNEIFTYVPGSSPLVAMT